MKQWLEGNLGPKTFFKRLKTFHLRVELKCQIEIDGTGKRVQLLEKAGGRRVISLEKGWLTLLAYEHFFL